MNEEQLENCKVLARVIHNKIKNNHPPECLDWWLQPCCTYGCVLGDYILKTKGYTDYDNFTKELYNVLESKEHIFSFDPAFIFGCEIAGTLQERLDYVIEQVKLKAGVDISDCLD